jgi:hypothetical protein
VFDRVRGAGGTEQELTPPLSSGEVRIGVERRIVDDLAQLEQTTRELTRSIIASSVGFVNATAELDVSEIADQLRAGNDDLLYAVLRALGLSGAFLAQELANRVGTGTTAEALEIVQVTVAAIHLTPPEHDDRAEQAGDDREAAPRGRMRQRGRKTRRR